MKAAVAGASGYAGGELMRLIAQHPHLSLGPVTADRNAGQPVTMVHPQLALPPEMEFLPTDPEILNTADIVFLALPHGESASIARQLSNETRVVDLGADHRLGQQHEWASYYPGDWAGAWTYGMPELPGARDRIRDSLRVANPGCYPTAIILSLYPLLAAGVIETDIVVVASSGTSGAGKKPAVNLLASEIMGSMSAYKVGGQHQHTPEIIQALSWAADSEITCSFTPTLAPMPRGILAVSSAHCSVTTEVVQEVLVEAYRHEPFVHVTSQQWPASGWTVGSNAVWINAAVDARAGRVTVVSSIDNLGKGAAGQALQNANLMLNYGETDGLSTQGVAP